MEATLVRFRIGAIRSLDPKLNVADQAELLPYDKKWEFSKKQLKLGMYPIEFRLLHIRGKS